MRRYAFQGFRKEKMARAFGLDLPISWKTAIMVCNVLRNKPLDDAKKLLNEVIKKKKAIPVTKYNFDRGHKKGIGPGRFPVKAGREILKIIESAEANAHQKNIENLILKHICVHRASKPWHYGRQRRRQMKRAHVEVVLAQKSTAPPQKVK